MATPKSSGKRITITELKKRAAKGDLSDKELRAYFAPDDAKTKPFAPALRLTELVDKEGKRLTARIVTGLYFAAEGAAYPPGAATKSGGGARSTTAAAKMRVLAEGDSVVSASVLLSGRSGRCPAQDLRDTRRGDVGRGNQLHGDDAEEELSRTPADRASIVTSYSRAEATTCSRPSVNM